VPPAACPRAAWPGPALSPESAIEVKVGKVKIDLLRLPLRDTVTVGGGRGGQGSAALPSLARIIERGAIDRLDQIAGLEAQLT